MLSLFQVGCCFFFSPEHGLHSSYLAKCLFLIWRVWFMKVAVEPLYLKLGRECYLPQDSETFTVYNCCLILKNPCLYRRSQVNIGGRRNQMSNSTFFRSVIWSLLINLYKKQFMLFPRWNLHDLQSLRWNGEIFFFRKASFFLFQNWSVSSWRTTKNAEQVSQEWQNRDKRQAEEAKFEQSPFPLKIRFEQWH